MSLLVSKRLGINVPPNIDLVNVSPEPKLLPVYQRSTLRKQTMVPPPPLLLPKRKKNKSEKTSNKKEEIETENDEDSQSPDMTSSLAARRHQKRLNSLRKNSQASLLQRRSSEAAMKFGNFNVNLKSPEEGDMNHLKPVSPYDTDSPVARQERSASSDIQSEMQNARKAVDILSKAFQKKKDVKINILKGIGEKEVQKQAIAEASKRASMQWFAKTLKNKKLNFLTKGNPYVEKVLTPFQKFRRAARKIKSLIQVCQVCRDITLDQVSGEDWFSKMESIIDSTDEVLSKPQGPSHTRPFITFVQDKESRQLVQLTFDKSLFTKERRADYLLTSQIREVLMKDSKQRTVEEENELLRFMKRATPAFNEYTMDAQRKLLKCMHYDRYEKDRVITKKNMMADGVYFVLSGTLVEQTDDKKSLREMKPGERFGVEDIICGCPRRVTVVTHSDVELLTVHRLDYRTIVNMADDSNDPKYLDICKEDIVFRHFPLRKLIENPGVWTVLSYKYGRLMVKDSNDIEWIYIIKSGEAKIVKHLSIGKVDLASRRKKVQQKIDDADPHAFQKKLINFVSERDYLQSHYAKGRYQPVVSSSRRSIQSAPSKESIRSSSRFPDSLNSPQERPQTSVATLLPTSTQYSEHINMDTDAFETNMLVPQIEIQSPSTNTASNCDGDREEILDDQEYTPSDHKEPRITILDNPETIIPLEGKQSAFINTSVIKQELKLPQIKKQSRMAKDERRPKLVTVPPFVQLESLHAGKVFGLRAVLDPSEQGPSASLISGGCEVLQISKKFFMKHIDDALLGLIKVQYKAFPTEEDLIDRLDNNFQWEEYKQNTVNDFLLRKGRITVEQAHNTEIVIT